MSRRRSRIAVLVCLVALSAGHVLAVDGVIEINQSRAIAGNITPGDSPNFPVQITSPGSYRLTSDLTLPPGVDAIDVTAGNVTIDLNGFNVVGGGGAIADGIEVLAVQNVEIRGGTIRGFSRNGVYSNPTASYVRLVGVRLLANATFEADLEGQGNLVDRCTAIGTNTGIRVFDGSMVTNTLVRGHSSFGLVLSGVGAGYGSCVLTGNNGGDANPQVLGGLQIGTNVCGSDTVCP